MEPKKVHKKQLKILYWNTRSLKERLQEVQSTAHLFDIIICVETWLQDKDNVKLPGFFNYRKDRSHAIGGGIIYFIRNNLSFIEIKNIKCPDNTVELCGVQFNNVNPPLNIYTCYRTPGHTLSQENWNLIVDNVKLENSIFLGDFNAHNVTWNCERTDSNGQRFSNALLENELFLHNFNTKTYVNVHKNYKSNIDLVFSTNDICDLTHVKVCDETWGSDHCLIFININIEKEVYTKKSFKLTSKKTDWSKFNEYLEGQYDSFLSSEYDELSPKQKYKKFIDLLAESVKSSTPKKKTTINKKNIKNPAAWWDEDCNRVKRIRKASYKKWEISNELKDLIAFKKNCAIAKKTFKTKKKEYFKKFAENLSFRTNPTYVWNTCKVLNKSWVKTTNINLTERLQNKEKVEKSLEKLCPAWVETDPTSIPRCQNNEFFDSMFTFLEFNVALDSKNAKSSPGMDGINFEILQRLSYKFKLLLLDIFNEMRVAAEYPESWKDSFVHFIPKSESDSLRPISLTSCLCKLFETIIKNRLEWWVEYNNFIPSSQHGFRKGKSCTDNIVNLTLKIEEEFKEKKEVLAAFLDIEGAFNNVNIDMMLQRLSEIGCSESVIKFIKCITHERHVYTEDLGNEYRRVFRGVPQGGVLSPLLFSIYTSRIAENLPKSVIVSQFADDFAMYIKFKTLQRSKKTFEKAIQTVETNLEKIGLEFSPKKTKLIHFNNKKIEPGKVEIKIKDHIIKSTNSTRFLGIIFDYQLSFVPQINSVLNKCMRSLNIIKFLRGKWWGSDPETLIILFKSYVRSLIEFGCFVYFPIRKTLANKLERIQYTAIRYALGYRNSTPTNILLGESKLLTIRERAIFLGKCYFAKVNSTKKSLVYQTIDSYKKTMKKKIFSKKSLLYLCIEHISETSKFTEQFDNPIIYANKFSTLLLQIPVNTKLGQELKESNNPNLELIELLSQSNSRNIFTDGSKITTSTYVGCSCICSDLNIFVKKSIHKQASIFTAECIAVEEALKIIIQNPYPKYSIFTDSLSVLLSISSSKITFKINPHVIEIKKKYLEYKKKIRTTKYNFFGSRRM